MADIAAHLVEDETFAYGGYAKVTADLLDNGDGVRFDDGHGPCWLVEMVQFAPGSDSTSLAVTVSNRSAHVAQVFADALHRPIDGMSADSDLHVRVLPVTAQVWMRM